ncbi:MAG TPA: ABC transporter permease [Gemmatimonadaceae bacterium]
MHRVLLRRLVQGLAVVAFATTASFVLVHLAPGEPFAIDDPRITPEVRAQWMRQFGLDRPLGEQYLRYLGNVARGELGWSFSQHRPVAAALGDAIPRTLLLMGTALVASLAAGIALGVWQARRRRGMARRLVSGASLVAYAIPDFWMALLVLLTFSWWFPILPAGGMVDPVMHDYLGAGGRALDVLRHLVLPVGTMLLLNASAIARYQHAALADTLSQDYVRTARAKGLDEGRVVWRHALRNALLPVITIVGLSLPALVGGAVFVEKVFSWPGMGLLLVNAVGSRDYPLVTAGVIAGALMVTVGSLLADLLYLLADPRMRDG